MTRKESYFWVKENGRYTLVKSIDGVSYFVRDIELPTVDVYYERILRKLDVHYKHRGDMLSIYNPRVVQWRNWTAPIATIEKGYIIVPTEPKQYTGKLPSVRMLHAAKKYYKEFCEKWKAKEFEAERSIFEEHFARQSKDGICCWWTGEEHFLDEKYFVFHLEEPGSPLEGLVILKSAILKPYITLKVPKRYVARVKGKYGRNAERLAKELGIRFVKIKAEKEN